MDKQERLIAIIGGSILAAVIAGGVILESQLAKRIHEQRYTNNHDISQKSSIVLSNDTQTSPVFYIEYKFNPIRD